jgi:hypothetical protein
MELITNILNTVTAYLPAVLQIVGGFALLATLTQNKADDKIAQIILDVINFVGGNIGKAKNGEV